MMKKKKVVVAIVVRILIFHFRWHTLEVKFRFQFQTQIFSVVFHRTLICVFLTNFVFYFHITLIATSTSFLVQSFQTPAQKVYFSRKPTQL